VGVLTYHSQDRKGEAPAHSARLSSQHGEMREISRISFGILNMPGEKKGIERPGKYVQEAPDDGC